MHAYVDQLAVYTDAVQSGTPPPVSGADGRAGVAAALALLEASRTGQVVALG
jgi:predicted dehydrogenase